MASTLRVAILAGVAAAAGAAVAVVARGRRARVTGGAAAPTPANVAPPRRAVLLVSPHAGSAGRLDRARRAMLAEGIELLEEVPIGEHERLDGWVSQSGERPLLVVAAGGDGTVGTAADHVANTPAVLGILPLGTSNDFARSVGIPLQPARAARLLATGKVSTLDAGRLVLPDGHTRHFAHAATAGLNVSFARLATQASLRRRFGRLTYAAAAAIALRQHESFRCELRYDDTVERLELIHLSVVNAPVFGGFLGLRVRHASVDDRALDVIAVEHLPWHRLVLAALHPVLGIRRRIRGIHTVQAPRVHVHSERELDVALDGEVLGRIPADFEVAGEALRVVTRRDFVDVADAIGASAPPRAS
jgi:YegS/Rv2252/BmrU family lipid kinase